MFSVLLIIMKEKLSQTDSGQNDNRFYSETIAIREKRLQNQTELSSEYSKKKKKERKGRNLRPLYRVWVGKF